MVDPIQLEVLWNRLVTLLEEQAKTLIRTSFTSILSDANDLSAGLFNKNGDMIAQAQTGTPGHINSMATGVRYFLKNIPTETLREGDVLIGNNPYEISGHLLDITIVTPVFLKGQFIGYVASTCHVADVGGLGFSPEGESIYEEGVLIPYMKFYEEGVIDETLVALLRANVRAPDQVLGDLRAQVVAQEVAIARLRETLAEFGLEDLEAVGAKIMHLSETAMRKAIAELPDGTYANELYSDGSEKPVRLKCALTVRGDEVHVDFSGTSDGSTKAINVCLNYTLAYVNYVLKATLAPDIPSNEGSFRPVSVSAPEGSVLNAVHPMPTAARHIIGHFAPMCVLGALYPLMPEKIPAEGAAAIFALQVHGVDLADEAFSYVVFNAGGTGARPGKDGLSATTFPSGVKGTPVEIIENMSPLLLHQKELRPDSGGVGEFRGGLGQTIRFGVRTNRPYHLPLMFDRTQFAPKGLDGGDEGAKAEVSINDEPVSASKKLYTLAPEDIVTMHLPGGGGIGNDTDRDPEARKDDLRKGYVTREKGY
ncbi:hydantoinase B/oxoprolinase family protein [Salicibibacter cibarius]|uniref:Hydantoinase B/oxoprolinase family protein n=1 Tax=Salicibibacter cibarius TaxID=2743000 RepID=A0A7T7CDG5_9BACI|nr:hydantoinase B/oxoprolinase family protein [Salicibibacter cibarius]QQK77945.1 hydantoinase B/oxoprolinase family protein [Salicibibacter cibarius]